MFPDRCNHHCPTSHQTCFYTSPPRGNSDFENELHQDHTGATTQATYDDTEDYGYDDDDDEEAYDYYDDDDDASVTREELRVAYDNYSTIGMLRLKTGETETSWKMQTKT